MDDTELQRTIVKRLNTLISLMTEIALSKETTSISNKIHHLNSLGLTPAEIGEIINKPTNYITATLHKSKKKEKI